MNMERVREFKAKYEDNPAAAREALEAALAELEGLNKKGSRMTPLEVQRAGYLIDLTDFLEEPQGGPAPGGFRAIPAAGGRDEERAFHRSLGEFLQKVACAGMPADGREIAPGVRTGAVHPDLYETRAATGMGEQPSLGGFLVAEDVSKELFYHAVDATSLFKRCKQFTISSNANSIKVPAIDESSRVDGSREGSLQLYWEGEGDALTASKPKFAQLQLTPRKLTGLAYASDEILQDSVILGQVIDASFRREFSYVLDNVILRGNGASQPLGILNGPSLVSVTGASSADTIVTADIAEMYSRLWPACEPNAEWFCNKDALPQLLQLTLGDSPIWLGANNLAGRPRPTLLGKPINFIEQASTVGDVGDLLLLDLSQYYCATKGGLQSAVSAHVRFVYDEMCYRFILRVDGQPAWASSLTPAQGTDAQSAFIAIATRT